MTRLNLKARQRAAGGAAGMGARAGPGVAVLRFTLVAVFRVTSSLSPHASNALRLAAL